MRQVCTYSGRISVENTMWSPDRDTPPGTLTTIFDYGDFLGDIEIVRLMRVFRTSALYEARRGKQMLLVKVAHEGAQEQLKREATVLAQLAEDRQHPMLPVLLNPYQFAETEVKQRPYGKTVFQDETKYYIVFEHAKGEFLRNTLMKNPQPWYQHAAWIAISLADALYFLHVKTAKLHLNLSPDVILIRTDKKGVPRPILLDLGLLMEFGNVDVNAVQEAAWPAYIAPEVFDRGGSFGAPTDVYGLGLVLYEMLAGHPAYKFRLQKDADILAAIRSSSPVPLNRSDLSSDITGIVNQAIDRVPARRFPDIRVFAKALRTKFGEVPPEKKGIRADRRLLAAGVFGVLAIVLWVIVLAILNVPVI